MQTKRFQKRKEDFVCSYCGWRVQGTGYTNHCPKCLYSKHVDINPGDRLADCHGLMEPIKVELKKGKLRLVHRCLKCDYQNVVKVADNDDFNQVLKVISKTH